MRFHAPLQRGRLVQRYKRFLADVALDGGATVTAHCANSGAMAGLKAPDSVVWLSPASNPDRKRKYTWELVEADGGLVGINTAWPNHLAVEAIRAGIIAPLAGYARLRQEVRYGRNSRIDVLLEDDARPACYVEVKNVHLRRDGSLAEFPDAVTARGAKHLEELGDMVEAGHRAAMLYLVQRMDCDRFAVAGDIDPTYAAGLRRARERGVEVLCYACRLTTEEIVVDRPLALTI
jgi:sugar fermentation stimulation protein A